MDLMNEKPVKTSAVLTDNVEFNMARMEKRLHALERKLCFVMDVSDDIIIEVQPRTGEMKLDSAKFFRLYGIPVSCLTLNELMAQLYSRLHSEDKRRFLSDFQVMSDGSFPMNMRTKTHQYRFLEQDDQCRQLQISASLYFNGTVEDVLFICIRNTTAGYSPDLHDFCGRQGDLTGAYNTNALEGRVTMQLSYKKTEGILAIYRLSNLELISEEMSAGSEAEAIAEFMSLIKRGIRQDDYIARTRPDEYMIFINGNRSRSAMERGVFEVKKRFAEYLEKKQLPSGITISVGIAFVAETDASFEALKLAAEMDMLPRE